jgi:predicted  nucleic acid-binding Zn-ribbon protein
MYRLLFFMLLTPLFMAGQIPDTVYSDAVTSYVLVDGQPVPEATISYTLMDTVNETELLVREALTNELGEDNADSLPVLRFPVGITTAAGQKAYENLIITNNGMGSVHYFSFTSEAKEVAKEGYIVSLPGQKITTLPIKYNTTTKTYNAVWYGQNVQDGIYLFHVPTSNGPVADKIKHIEGRPGHIDYGAEPKEKAENESLRSAEETKELAVSKYAINITKEGLEDFVDTVWVQENTPHDFFFNVNEIQYDDAIVNGWIDFTTGGSPTSADVEYKRLLNQSETYTTVATDGYYQIDVPVVYEPQNPGQTKYIVTISANEDPFITEIDTVLVAPGVNYFQHYVIQQVTEVFQDIQGTVRNVYSKQPESGVIVRVINRNSGELIEEDITGSDGQYFFADISAGTPVEFELGKTGELWMVNNEYDVPEEISDTLVTFNRYFYPKNVEVPQVGTNTTILGDGEEAAEMVGGDYVNFEEVLRDQDLMWANGPNGSYWSARSWIENNFYEGNSPITTTSTERNITEDMQQNYDPYTNYYPGQLGWNVNFGSGNTTSHYYSGTEYGVVAIMGGEIMTTGLLKEYIKELQGRRLDLGAVSSRESMMNSNPAMPTEKDRAYVYIIRINQKGRFDTSQETYSLENLTSTEPDRGTRGYTEEGKYTDRPGNKPHCKAYPNLKKLEEQFGTRP